MGACTHPNSFSTRKFTSVAPRVLGPKGYTYQCLAPLQAKRPQGPIPYYRGNPLHREVGGFLSRVLSHSVGRAQHPVPLRGLDLARYWECPPIKNEVKTMGTKLPTDGIQMLPEVLNAGPGVLTEGNVTLIDQVYGQGNLKRSFLLKQIIAQYGWDQEQGSTGDSVLIGFANGSMGTVEIAAQLATVLANPNDIKTWDDYAQMGGIFWQTIRQILNGTTTYLGIRVSETITIGGGKGIPLIKDEGILLWVYNASTGAIASGNKLIGMYALIGVWLDDS